MKLENLLALCIALMAIVVSPALSRAQDSADSKQAEGKYHLAIAKTHNLHANDHLKLLKKYAAAHKTVPADVLKDHAATVQYHVQAAQKSYAKLAAVNKDNPDLLKQIDVINKRLAKVSDLVKKLESQSTESVQVVAQTDAITRELAANEAASRAADNSFYNMESANYYTDGLGHFVD